MGQLHIIIILYNMTSLKGTVTYYYCTIHDLTEGDSYILVTYCSTL